MLRFGAVRPEQELALDRGQMKQFRQPSEISSHRAFAIGLRHGQGRDLGGERHRVNQRLGRMIGSQQEARNVERANTNVGDAKLRGKEVLDMTRCPLEIVCIDQAMQIHTKGLKHPGRLGLAKCRVAGVLGHGKRQYKGRSNQCFGHGCATGQGVGHKKLRELERNRDVRRAGVGHDKAADETVKNDQGK
ncbi:hypothetical protein D3C87_1355580 [compost metagenome]